MNQKLLKRSGIKISELAFGGVEIGMPYGIGVKSKADMPSQSESIRLLHAAVVGGINFFDTARLYGASESIMGSAFQNIRNKVVISTKCRFLRNELGVLPPPGRLKRFIERSLQESLVALKTDFVDIFMLHKTDAEILGLEEVGEVFINLKKRGIIRATGVSTYSVEETKRALESGVWDVIQLPYNLMDQSQAVNFSLATEKGIDIVARSVLFKGILSERGKNLHPALKDVEQHIKLYKDLLTDSVSDLATLAIKFALSTNQVSSVLIGIDRMEYLRKSLAIVEGGYLEKEILDRAKELQCPDLQFLDLVKWNNMGWLT